MNRVRLGLGEETCDVPAHVCFVHHGDDELRALALAVLRPAVEEVTSAIGLFGPPGAAAWLLDALETGLGRSLAPEVSARRIVLHESDSDPDDQLRSLVDPIEDLAARGFDPIRLIGIVSWATPGYPVPEDFLWYESKITAAIATLPVILICTYDVTRLPAEALLYGALETHPQMLVGDRLAENPFRVPEARFLDRLLKLPWLDAG